MLLVPKGRAATKDTAGMMAGTGPRAHVASRACKESKAMKVIQV